MAVLFIAIDKGELNTKIITYPDTHANIAITICILAYNFVLPIDKNNGAKMIILKKLRIMFT